MSAEQLGIHLDHVLSCATKLSGRICKDCENSSRSQQGLRRCATFWLPKPGSPGALLDQHSCGRNPRSKFVLLRRSTRLSFGTAAAADSGQHEESDSRRTATRSTARAEATAQLSRARARLGEVGARAREEGPVVCVELTSPRTAASGQHGGERRRRDERRGEETAEKEKRREMRDEEIREKTRETETREKRREREARHERRDTRHETRDTRDER